MPSNELKALQAGFFRSAMMSMAFRYQADLILENISVIFDVDDKENQTALITYNIAVIERSPEKFIEEMENIDFTIKPEPGSIWAQLEERGMVKGIEKGIEKGKVFQSFISLLKIFIKFPDWSVSEMANFTDLNSEFIESFLKIIKARNLKKANSFIQKGLFPESELNEEERNQINDLLKKILKK